MRKSYGASKDREDEWVQNKIGEVRSGGPEALMNEEKRQAHVKSIVGLVWDHHNKVRRNLFAGRGSPFSL